jgi:selenocysteine-specific elongation factor
MEARRFIVATAGHVDHGKSALVQALTGTDPDRLPEEKARGITIDLGFARLVLPGLDLGIVDVPGHEDFIQNMAAGVGAVDAALFVVAADDLWMPQTEEHLQILSYFGVRRAVVALAKIDLATDEAAAIRHVRERLAGSPFADAPVIATSIPQRRGIQELKAALAGVLGDAEPPPDWGKPRLPIDRVFALRGLGTVVTGTLAGGSFSRGERVSIQPSGKAAQIRSAQNHHTQVDAGGPGMRIALNLPDLAASGEGAVRRGEVVTREEFGGPSQAVDVLLNRSERLAAQRALASGARVRLHLGTGHWNARLTLLEGGELAPGGQAIARLRVDAPVFAFAGDRFILRDGSERATLAGGIVLDPAPVLPLRRAAQRRFLGRAAAALDDPATQLTARLERDHAMPRAGLPHLRANWRAETAADQLLSAGTLVTAGPMLLDGAWWKSLGRKAAAHVDATHRERPELIGLPLSELQASLARDLPDAALFPWLIESLTRDGFVRSGAAVRRSSHEPALPLPLRAAGARIREALKARPLEPPSREQLAPDAVSRQALRFLRDTGEVIELNEEVFVFAESFLRSRAAIIRYLRTMGPATSSELRQMLGTTRRILIPLLERLDRDGVTRREGDRRALREAAHP